MCPSLLNLLPPTHPTPSRLSQSTRCEFPASFSKFPLLILCFTYGNVYVSILFSQNHPTLPFPEDVLRLSVKPSHSQNPQVPLGETLPSSFGSPPRLMPAALIPPAWELPYLDFSNRSYRHPALLVKNPPTWSKPGSTQPSSHSPLQAQSKARLGA